MALVARLTDIYGQPIDIDRPMTADEFLAIVDRLPYRAELIDGEVVVDAPSYRHQDAFESPQLPAFAVRLDDLFQ